MKITWMRTGADGQTAFEDLEIATTQGGRGDGTVRHIGTGDALLADDLDGQGHKVAVHSRRRHGGVRSAG